jgi:hypothetical protein
MANCQFDSGWSDSLNSLISAGVTPGKENEMCEPQIELGFDPELVKKALEQETWSNDDQEQRAVYLGRMIWPSGKFYTPWARSNVTPCPTCGGKGTHPTDMETCNICEGRKYRSVTDLMKRRNEPRDVVIHSLVNDFHTTVRPDGETFVCNACGGDGAFPAICPTCDGLGSEEAYHDELWREQCADLYDEYEFSVECDSTDVFAVQYREKQEET